MGQGQNLNTSLYFLRFYFLQLFFIRQLNRVRKRNQSFTFKKFSFKYRVLIKSKNVFYKIIMAKNRMCYNKGFERCRPWWIKRQHSIIIELENRY